MRSNSSVRNCIAMDSSEMECDAIVCVCVQVGRKEQTENTIADQTMFIAQQLNCNERMLEKQKKKTTEKEN